MKTGSERDILLTICKQLDQITGKHSQLANLIIMCRGFCYIFDNFTLFRWAWCFLFSPQSTTFFSFTNNPTQTSYISCSIQKEKKNIINRHESKGHNPFKKITNNTLDSENEQPLSILQCSEATL